MVDVKLSMSLSEGFEFFKAADSPAFEAEEDVFGGFEMLSDCD